MINQFTYSERASVKWLVTVLLALNCFAFSLSPVSAQARQPMPVQIEQLHTSARDSANDSFSIFSFADFDAGFRSIAYEKYILIDHQERFCVAFKKIKEKSLSIAIPYFNSIQFVSHPDSDDPLPPVIIS